MKANRQTEPTPSSEASLDTPPPDFDLEAYDFELPPDLIAQVPPEQRGASRLLVLDRRSGELVFTEFSRLPEHLDPQTLLVVNNSRVIPARLHGLRPSGGRAEFLLLTPLPLLRPAPHPPGGLVCRAEGLLRSSKRIREGETVTFSPDLQLCLEKRGEYGRCQVSLRWRGDFAAILDRLGSLPLPPYIRRAATDLDAERYQTVYAARSKNGSMAAPTAGLHFTGEMRERLTARGHSWAELTLYVGYGTFSPVRCRDIREHQMHSEYFELSPDVAGQILAARAAGRKVLAVGTTAARSLESAALAVPPGQALPRGHAGWTDIFLYPGRPVNITDQLLTNFHLPKSSLIMLAAAFAGRERILQAYREAVARKMRFFSYGDAMLIK